MKKEIKETLDTKGKFRCVRFASGGVDNVAAKAMMKEGEEIH
ncbi:MAG: hypothetical protein U0L19_01340 [Bacteroidales bacterium]|nr:hypothetical protein [Bacteroidales bacterium]